MNVAVPGDLLVVNSVAAVSVKDPAGRPTTQLRSGDVLLVIAMCWQTHDRPIGLCARTGSMVTLPHAMHLERAQ